MLRRLDLKQNLPEAISGILEKMDSAIAKVLNIFMGQVLYLFLFLLLKLKVYGCVLLNISLFCFQAYLVFEEKVVPINRVQCF